MARWTPPPVKRKDHRPWAMRNIDYHCAKCGADNDLELDHIRNLKAGGKDTRDNLQWLCKACHFKKTQAEAKIGMNAWKRPQEEHPAIKRAKRLKETKPPEEPTFDDME